MRAEFASARSVCPCTARHIANLWPKHIIDREFVRTRTAVYIRLRCVYCNMGDAPMPSKVLGVVQPKPRQHVCAPGGFSQPIDGCVLGLV